MTLKEIRKFLDNTKVYVNGKSKEIQEKLFSFGYKWGDISTKIQHVQEPFLYTDNNLFYYGNNMTEFMYDKRKEISADEILSLEVTEPSYRPFKNKDECWEEMQKHKPFGWFRYRKEGHYEPIRIDISEDLPFANLFNTYNFADGTPFGILEN